MVNDTFLWISFHVFILLMLAIVKGLDEGATVVTSGQLKLKNGTPLIINNKVSPANSPNPKPQEN